MSSHGPGLVARQEGGYDAVRLCRCLCRVSFDYVSQTYGGDAAINNG